MHSCDLSLPGSVRGEGPKRSRRRAPEAFPGYDKMPDARLAERQNDGGRDFGVSWLASACSHSQPTSHLPQKYFPWMQAPRRPRQTTSLRTHPSSGPVIWRRPDFPSIGSIGRNTVRSLASRLSSCMAGRVQAATARPPGFSIRSDTASCFSTSAVAARARPVRAMMTQHRR
jgi:hypothetical protein